MLTCKEAIQLVSEGLDRNLPWSKRMGLKMHLLMCRHCSAYSRQIRGLARVFHLRFSESRAIEGRHGESLTPEARDKIKSSLRRHSS